MVVSVLPIRSDCHLLRADLAYAEMFRKILRHVDGRHYKYKHKADGGWSMNVRTQKSHSLFLSGFDRASWNRATAFERFSVIVLLALRICLMRGFKLVSSSGFWTRQEHCEHVSEMRDMRQQRHLHCAAHICKSTARLSFCLLWNTLYHLCPSKPACQGCHWRYDTDDAARRLRCDLEGARRCPAEADTVCGRTAAVGLGTAEAGPIARNGKGRT